MIKIKWFFTELITLLYLTIITPDPCKRCIVRVMCSEVCDRRTKYIQIFGSQPGIQRLNAFAIILGLLATIWGAITLIFK